MYRFGSDWSSDCHVVGDHSVTTVVMALVVDSVGWERQLLNRVIHVVVCLKNRSRLKTVTIGGVNLVGRAIAAALVPNILFVTGMVTLTSVFHEIQK